MNSRPFSSRVIIDSSCRQGDLHGVSSEVGRRRKERAQVEPQVTKHWAINFVLTYTHYVNETEDIYSLVCLVIVAVLRK